MNIETTQSSPQLLTAQHLHSETSTNEPSFTDHLAQLWHHRDQIVDRCTDSLRQIPQKLLDNKQEIAIGTLTNLSIRTGLAVAGATTYATGAVAAAGTGAIRTYLHETKNYQPTTPDAPVHATQIFSRHFSKSQQTELPQDASLWNKVTHYTQKAWNSGEKLAMNLTAGYYDRHQAHHRINSYLDQSDSSPHLLQLYQRPSLQSSSDHPQFLSRENEVRTSEKNKQHQSKNLLTLDFLTEQNQAALTNISHDIGRLFVSHTLSQGCHRQEYDHQYKLLHQAAQTLANNENQRLAITAYIRQEMKSYYRIQAKNAIKGIATAQLYKAPLKYATTLGVLNLDEHTLDLHGRIGRFASQLTDKILSTTAQIAHAHSPLQTPNPSPTLPALPTPHSEPILIHPSEPILTPPSEPTLIPLSETPSPTPTPPLRIAPAMRESGYVPTQLNAEQQTRIDQIQSRLQAMKPQQPIRIRSTFAETENILTTPHLSSGVPGDTPITHHKIVKLQDNPSYTLNTTIEQQIISVPTETISIPDGGPLSSRLLAAGILTDYTSPDTAQQFMNVMDDLLKTNALTPTEAEHIQQIFNRDPHMSWAHLWRTANQEFQAFHTLDKFTAGFTIDSTTEIANPPIAQANTLESTPTPEIKYPTIDLSRPDQLTYTTNITPPQTLDGYKLTPSPTQFKINNGIPFTYDSPDQLYETVTITRLPGYSSHDHLSTEPGSSFLMWFCTQKNEQGEFIGRGMYEMVSANTPVDSPIQEPKFIFEAHSYGTINHSEKIYTYYPGEIFRQTLTKELQAHTDTGVQFTNQFIDTQGRLHLKFIDQYGATHSYISRRAINIDLRDHPGFAYLEVQKLFREFTQQKLSTK